MVKIVYEIFVCVVHIMVCVEICAIIRNSISDLGIVLGVWLNIPSAHEQEKKKRVAQSNLACSDALFAPKHPCQLKLSG